MEKLSIVSGRTNRVECDARRLSLAPRSILPTGCRKHGYCRGNPMSGRKPAALAAMIDALAEARPTSNPQMEIAETDMPDGDPEAPS
ncbi:hypothetical protein [Burkholderia sp. Cy-637]|uniref:hypothetical protein n=1 Tax=Burkholderia sp. Cy-637 TaxID=2608327 RepID=UPI00141EA922|nr:hypothetical protein [Burkholderia sp. Cy-637]NIF88815.1 hypothetical protein [Burkholderia sp. Cy-637]